MFRPARFAPGPLWSGRPPGSSREHGLQVVLGCREVVLEGGAPPPWHRGGIERWEGAAALKIVDISMEMINFSLIM